ncbi:MAG: glycoside hydrolase family 2 TIM barrel-domain containing protein [Ktedonobacteraceae bacterium]
MFDRWQLKDYAPGEGNVVGAFHEQFDTHEWLDVSVPGDVHQALLAAGRITDPFYDQNEKECAWIEEREWWYRVQFALTQAPLAHDERMLLVFHGLDTFVTIWLNGKELGKSSNMFREAVFAVSHALYHDHPNTLALCFDRPLDHMQKFETWGPNPERVTMRKAQFGYGWDWGPRLPTIGIWRSVELLRQRKVAITGVHFSTLDIDVSHEKALASVEVTIEQFANRHPLDAVIELLSKNEQNIQHTVVTQRLSLSGSDTSLSATAYLQIEHPTLWWTHDLGRPDVYVLRVTLHQGDNQLAHHQQTVGIRTLTLDQSPDTEERGTRFFRFVLNGVPIFVRGANWIPAHSFVGAIAEQRYVMLLTAARDANMNMLRVWGGGIYEYDSFYKLCNSLGLLIWQDFMFACAMYPEHIPSFVQEVEEEARYQVQRLRNHPCLALWCGNNENQWIHDRAYWDRPDYPVPGSLFYHSILPKLVQELDGVIPYWPGSPYGGNDYNGADDGDVHNWQAWHGNIPRRFGEPALVDQTPAGVSFTHYAEDMGRFISEFGMHASPVYETLRRNIPADQLYFHSPSMDHHNKDNPKNKGDNLMLTVTGLPQDLTEYIDYSMIAQAEGLKFALEHYRRRKPHCSGTLIWQLNDCWPVLSWSLLDYYGFGKAGYFYVKRAYAPVLASFKQRENQGVELWLTNDTLSEIVDIITIKLGSFTTGTQWEVPHPIKVPANSSQLIWQKEVLQSSASHYLTVSSDNKIFPANRHFFVPIKDLQRISPHVKVTITQQGAHELHVSLHASAYAYFLHFTLANEHTHFSDNYFDLEAGEDRVIVVTNTMTPLTPDMLSIKWR